MPSTPRYQEMPHSAIQTCCDDELEAVVGRVEVDQQVDGEGARWPAANSDADAGGRSSGRPLGSSATTRAPTAGTQDDRRRASGMPTTPSEDSSRSRTSRAGGRRRCRCRGRSCGRSPLWSTRRHADALSVDAADAVDGAVDDVRSNHGDVLERLARRGRP